ncbi:MAG: flagellar hook-basal body complex protein FliE [Aquabacterium sp.]|nr:MAG: flagellar hook-basal body complex protein FliE [Aquabacterium sp.]
MMEALSGIAAISSLAPQAAGSVAEGGEPTGFAAVFDAQVEGVNQDLSRAETQLQRLAAGQPVELHDVMISLETARISVMTVIQVRNKLVEAYQELSRMQV